VRELPFPAGELSGVDLVGQAQPFGGVADEHAAVPRRSAAMR
jgi:hypothetical protein